MGSSDAYNGRFTCGDAHLTSPKTCRHDGTPRTSSVSFHCPGSPKTRLLETSTFSDSLPLDLGPVSLLPPGVEDRETGVLTTKRAFQLFVSHLLSLPCHRRRSCILFALEEYPRSEFPRHSQVQEDSLSWVMPHVSVTKSTNK